MTREEWDLIAARMSVAFPHQALPEATLAEWYDELDGYDAGEVWLGVRWLRREKEHASLASLLVAIRLHRQETAQAAAEQRQDRDRDVWASRRGVPPPPEYVEARRIYDELLGGRTEHGRRREPTREERAEARASIDVLADRLEERLNARPSWERSSGATRVCGVCATSPVAGYERRVLAAGTARPEPIDVYVPCSGCEPERYAAWDAGRLHHRLPRRRERQQHQRKTWEDSFA